MSKLKIELNSAGIQAMLKSPEMQAICREHAQEISGGANGAYDISVQVGKKRCNASVFTEDKATINDNLKNNTLLKAVGR